MLFALMRQKAPMVEQGFFINKKYLYTKRSDLSILLNKNLESTFIEINLPNILTCQ